MIVIPHDSVEEHHPALLQYAPLTSLRLSIPSSEELYAFILPYRLPLLNWTTLLLMR